MIVLTRKLFEKVVIGKDIVITIIEIGSGKVRLGVECPRDVPVYRLEYMPEEARPRSEVYRVGE